jgi:outer membrane protein TolC
MATGLDTARLEAQMANERQQLAVARYEVARLHANLLNLLGIIDPVKLVLTDALKQDAGDMPRFEDAVGVAFGERPEVKAQAQRIKTANLALRSTVSERLPSITGQGDYGLIGNRYNNTLDTYNVGVFLNVPLFDGGQREGRIKEARSQMRQEAIRLDVVKQQVMLDVREALVTLASAKEQFAIAQDGVRAALAELDLAADRFRQLSGATTLEVTNAMFNLSRARENAVEALFRLNASRVNLSRGLGLMNEYR